MLTAMSDQAMAAIGIYPPMSAVLEQACIGVRRSVMTRLHSLSICQSGRWGRYRSFTSIQTNVEHVNAACTSFGDPNPPNYNALQYQLTCGSRYCSTVLGYGFGMINENGPGYKLDSPYNSDPSAFVSIACAR